MRVCTVLGTRPEIIRLSRVMACIESTPGMEHVLVHTGQNYDYELNGVFFEDLEVRQPDYFLEVSRESVGRAYGDIIAKSEEVFIKEQPDALLVLGDTNSALAAIIAKRMHIPTFHMEAGNRSFDHNVPEEVNRKIVDHVSDINLVYTENARRHLLAEGKSHREVYVTGSPMREVLNHQAPKIAASTATADLGLEPGTFFVISAHREENVDHPARLQDLLETLVALHAEFGYEVVVSLAPPDPQAARSPAGRSRRARGRAVPSAVRVQRLSAPPDRLGLRAVGLGHHRRGVLDVGVPGGDPAGLDRAPRGPRRWFDHPRRPQGPQRADRSARPNVGSGAEHVGAGRVPDHRHVTAGSQHDPQRSTPPGLLALPS